MTVGEMPQLHLVIYNFFLAVSGVPLSSDDMYCTFSKICLYPALPVPSPYQYFPPAAIPKLAHVSMLNANPKLMRYVFVELYLSASIA